MKMVEVLLDIHVQMLPFTHIHKEINLSGTETVLFCENKVNIKAADALASCVTKPSAAMVSTIK